MKLLISPHNDDETLFAAFTILRHRPLVVVVTDSARQAKRGLPISAQQRRRETLDAMEYLGISTVKFLGIPDDELTQTGLRNALAPYMDKVDEVWVPNVEPSGGNQDHDLVGSVAAELWPACHRYATYTREGKSRRGSLVPWEKCWPELKLRALACYTSQIAEPSTAEHFLRDQFEYVE